MDDVYPVNDFLNVCAVLDEVLAGKVKYIMADAVIYQDLKVDNSGEYARRLSADLAAFYSSHNWTWKTGSLTPDLTYVVDEDTVYIYNKTKEDS